MLNQKNWRIMGIIFLVGAGSMAVGSVVTPVLKNTLIWLLSFSNEEAAEKAASISPWSFILYWCLFAVCVLGALYMAMLDIRYIRLEYALAKRNLLKETIGATGSSPISPENDIKPNSE